MTFVTRQASPNSDSRPDCDSGLLPSWTGPQNAYCWAWTAAASGHFHMAPGAKPRHRLHRGSEAAAGTFSASGAWARYCPTLLAPQVFDAGRCHAGRSPGKAAQRPARQCRQGCWQCPERRNPGWRLPEWWPGQFIDSGPAGPARARTCALVFRGLRGGGVPRTGLFPTRRAALQGRQRRTGGNAAGRHPPARRRWR